MHTITRDIGAVAEILFLAARATLASENIDGSNALFCTNTIGTPCPSA